MWYSAALLIVACCGVSSSRAQDGAFVDVAAARGLEISTWSGSAAKVHIRETLGQGVCVIDYDLDGDRDVFVPNGAVEVRDTYRDNPQLLRPWSFYERRGGRWVEIADSVGLDVQAWGIGCAVGDVDGDGYDDLFVTTAASTNRLFHNRRGSGFEDWTERSGVGAEDLSASAAFGDLDRDGDLDLFVTRYVDEAHPPSGQGCNWKGTPVMCGPKGYRMLDALLYFNDGTGRFLPAPEDAGVKGHPGFGLGVVLFDPDRDEDLDVYVANDSSPKHLFVNDGDGRFEELAMERGVALSDAGAPQAGMGVDAADIDGDGLTDLVVTNFSDDIHNFYHNDDGLFFTEWSHRSGLAAASFSMLGWAVLLEDFDLDGDVDLVTTNGHVFPQVEPHDPNTTYRQPVQLFVNDGRGRFGASAIGPPIAGRGAATTDFDGDGDVDILVTRDGEAPMLLENRLPPQNHHWVRVELAGLSGNPRGLGAHVELVSGGRRQVRMVRAARGYLSSSDPTITFGLGTADAVERVTVRWPHGEVTVIEDLAVDRSHRIEPDRRGLLADLRNRGAALYEARSAEAAKALYERGVAVAPDSAPEQYNLALVHWKLGDRTAAERGFASALAADPQFPHGYYGLGILRKNAGDLEGARVSFLAAMNLIPDEPSVHYQLALIDRQSGRDTDAMARLNALIGLDPDHAGARYQRHQLLVRTGDAARANEALGEVRRLKLARSHAAEPRDEAEHSLMLPVTGEYGVARIGAPAPKEERRLELAMERIGGPVDAAAIVDLDVDGRIDLIAANAGTLAIWKNEKPGGFTRSASIRLPTRSPVREILADRWADRPGPLFLVRTADRAFLGGPPWHELRDAARAPWALLDWNRDGHLDLVAGGRLLLSARDGTLTRDTTTELAITHRAQAVRVAALGRPDAQDLVVLQGDGAIRVHREVRGRGYEGGTEIEPGCAGRMAIGDLDGDGRFDLVTSGNRLCIHRHLGALRFETHEMAQASGWPVVGDFDADGRADVLLLRAGSESALWLNLGELAFRQVAVPGLLEAPIRGAWAVDVDADARLDALVLAGRGVRLFRNVSEATGRAVNVTLRATRSPPSGRGARLEVRSGTRLQLFAAEGLPIHVGLGDGSWTPAFRVLWPNGLLEDQLGLAGSRTVVLTQSDRPPSSWASE